MIDAPYAADRIIDKLLKITEELFVEIRTDLLPEFEDYINDLEGRIRFLLRRTNKRKYFKINQTS